MSVQALAWTFDHARGIDPTRRLCLIGLANNASETGWAWSSWQTLGEFAECSPDTARRAIVEDAAARGWLIEIDPYRPHIPIPDDIASRYFSIRRDRRPRLWIFAELGAGSHDATPQGDEGAPTRPRTRHGVATGSRRGSTAVPPDPRNKISTTAERPGTGATPRHSPGTGFIDEVTFPDKVDDEERAKVLDLMAKDRAKRKRNGGDVA